MNEERFRKLYSGIGELVRGHLAGGELEREKVYEALSALGIMGAVVVLGAGEEAALEYFIETIIGNIEAGGEEFGAPVGWIGVYRGALGLSKGG